MGTGGARSNVCWNSATYSGGKERWAARYKLAELQQCIKSRPCSRCGVELQKNMKTKHLAGFYSMSVNHCTLINVVPKLVEELSQQNLWLLRSCRAAC